MKPFLALLAAAGLSVACLFAHSAAAADASRAKPVNGKYLLRYKFAMGEVLRYQVKHATNVRTTIDNSTQQLETQSDSVKAWKVTDVLPSGEMEFMHVVESVRMSNKAPGKTANTYDSAVDKTPPRGFEQAAGAVGVPLVAVRIAPDGKVTFREKKHLPQQAPPDDMPITLELPENAVAVGATWSHSYDVPVERSTGAKSQVRTRRICRLKQVRAGIALVEVKYQILTPVDPVIRAQIVERLTEGTVRFDIERGRVVQQRHVVDRREVGFAPKATASSMHFVARLEERLLESSTTAPDVRTAAATSAK